MRGAAFALAAYGAYSTHDVVVKWLGERYAPAQILFFAMLFGFPLLTVLLIRDRTDGNLRPHHPWWMLLRVFAAVVGTVSAFYAFAVLPLAQTYSIIFAAPLLITVLAIPALGERVGWRRLVAVGIGLLGVLIVLRPGAEPLSRGHLAALACAVCSAMAGIIVRKIGPDERSAVLLLYPMMGNLIVMGMALPWVYQPMPLLDLGALALIAGLNLLGTLCIILAYKAAPAGVVAPMQYSQMLWAIVYGAAFFGEGLDGPTAIGAAVIVGSGLYVVFREDRPNVSSARPVLGARGWMVGVLPARIAAMVRTMRGGL